MSTLSVTPYDSQFASAGLANNVDPDLGAAVAAVESQYSPTAVSPKGAQGLMQLMPGTAQGLGVTNPVDPTQNINGGMKYLSQMLTQFGNVPDALMHYNAGPNGNVNNPETQAYVGQVQAAYQDIKRAGGIQYAQPGQQTAQNGASDSPMNGAPAQPNDAFSQAFGSVMPTGAPAAASTNTNDAFSQAFGPALAAGSKPSSARSAPAATSPGPTTITGQIAAGLGRGVQDLGDTLDNLTAWGDRNIPGAQAIDTGLNTAGNAINSAMGLPNGGLGRTPAMNQQILAQDAVARAAYQQQSGQSIPAAIGRAAGNIAVTAPLMATGVGAAGGLADAAGITNALTGTAVAVPGGNLLLGAGRVAAATGAGGAIAGGSTAGGNGQSVGEGALHGGEVGLALGPAGALIGKGVGAVGNALTGGAIDGGRQALADMAVKQYGIPLTAPQMSTSGAAKWIADAADTSSGGQGVAKAAAGQLSAWQQAVSHTFGADSSVFTPEVMQSAKDNLGQTFDNIANKTTIVADQPLTDGLMSIQKEAGQVLPASEVVPIQNQISNVLSSVGDDGTISGTQYQALTRKGAPLDRAIQSDDPNVSFYSQQVRNSLDDAMQRSLQASGQTDLLNQLQQTRMQYKNLMTVAPIAAKSIDGTISPALLMARVNANFQNNAFQGAGDLGNLAKIGQAFLKPLPSSGTAERSLAIQRISNAAEGVGMLATGHPAMGAIALAKIPVQMAVGRAVGSAMNSRAAANALLARSAPQAASMVPNSLLGRLQNLGAGYAPQVVPSLAAPVNRLLNKN